MIDLRLMMHVRGFSVGDTAAFCALIFLPAADQLLCFISTMPSKYHMTLQVDWFEWALSSSVNSFTVDFSIRMWC